MSYPYFCWQLLKWAGVYCEFIPASLITSLTHKALITDRLATIYIETNDFSAALMGM